MLKNWTNNACTGTASSTNPLFTGSCTLSNDFSYYIVTCVAGPPPPPPSYPQNYYAKVQSYSSTGCSGTPTNTQTFNPNGECYALGSGSVNMVCDAAGDKVTQNAWLYNDQCLGTADDTVDAPSNNCYQSADHTYYFTADCIPGGGPVTPTSSGGVLPVLNEYSTSDCSGTPLNTMKFSSNGECYQITPGSVNIVCNGNKATNNLWVSSSTCTGTADSTADVPVGSCEPSADGTYHYEILCNTPTPPVAPSVGCTPPGSLAASVVIILGLIAFL